MKLIDWKDMPLGAVVVGQAAGDAPIFAKYICAEDASSAVVLRNSGLYDIYLGDLRIATAEQQEWILYEEGVTVIPEWLDVHYRGLSMYLQHDEILSYEEKEWVVKDIGLLGYVREYMVIGLKDGWTDNPSEVVE